MDNVKQYSRFIKRIVTASDLIRVKLLRSSNLKIITAIAEIVYNIIHKNIKVSPSTLGQLKKFKKVLYRLVEAKNAIGRKKILIDNPKCLVPLATLFK
jgi:hypothetical protein